MKDLFDAIDEAPDRKFNTTIWTLLRDLFYGMDCERSNELCKDLRELGVNLDEVFQKVDDICMDYASKTSVVDTAKASPREYRISKPVRDVGQVRTTNGRQYCFNDFFNNPEYENKPDVERDRIVAVWDGAKWKYNLEQWFTYDPATGRYHNEQLRSVGWITEATEATSEKDDFQDADCLIESPDESPSDWTFEYKDPYCHIIRDRVRMYIITENKPSAVYLETDETITPKRFDLIIEPTRSNLDEGWLLYRQESKDIVKIQRPLTFTPIKHHVLGTLFKKADGRYHYVIFNPTRDVNDVDYMKLGHLHGQYDEINFDNDPDCQFKRENLRICSYIVAGDFRYFVSESDEKGFNEGSLGDLKEIQFNDMDREEAPEDILEDPVNNPDGWNFIDHSEEAIRLGINRPRKI